jgi:multicomponent Na+:H+ antiporter subunit B
MDAQVILRVTARLLVPAIWLFALYVQFHGDFGPGGGFQAGVLFAVGFILYALVEGLAAAETLIPAPVSEAMMALGVLLYAGVGVASLALGGNFLDYGVLAHDPQHGQHLGILLVELGVGITVAGVMIQIFSAFARESP